MLILTELLLLTSGRPAPPVSLRFSLLEALNALLIEGKAGRPAQVMTPTSYLSSLHLSFQPPTLLPPDIPYFIFHHFHPPRDEDLALAHPLGPCTAAVIQFFQSF